MDPRYLKMDPRMGHGDPKDPKVDPKIDPKIGKGHPKAAHGDP